MIYDAILQYNRKDMRQRVIALTLRCAQSRDAEVPMQEELQIDSIACVFAVVLDDSKLSGDD